MSLPLCRFRALTHSLTHSLAPAFPHSAPGTLSTKNPVALFDLLFVGPLLAFDAMCTVDGVSTVPPVVIVIDGLDEVQSDDLSLILSVLTRDWMKLPPWLGLFLTSRGEKFIERRLRSLRPIVLDTDSDTLQASVWSHS